MALWLAADRGPSGKLATNLSGILVYQRACNAPGYDPGALVISLREVPHMSDNAVLGFIHGIIAADVPLYLTRQVARVETPLIFLNNFLGPFVRAGDGPSFVASLTRLAGLISSACRPDP
jgi:hypothetical protein